VFRTSLPGTSVENDPILENDYNSNATTCFPASGNEGALLGNLESRNLRKVHGTALLGTAAYYLSEILEG